MLKNLHLLTILFIGLKLGDVIDWSWWFVLLPSYGVAAIALSVMAFSAFGLGVVSIVAARSNKG